MMSLIETNSFSVFKKQYLYKLEVNFNLIFIMTILQIAGIFIAIIGISTDNNFIQMAVHLKHYSGNIPLIVTITSLFVIAFLLTKKTSRNVDFTFVSNRMSSNLSNMAFILTATLFGGVTASLGGIFVRVLTYFTLKSSHIYSSQFSITPRYFLMNFLVIFLYCLMFSAAGYFIGSFIQNNRVFKVIVCLLLALIIILSVIDSIHHRGQPLGYVAKFFFLEGNLAIFTIKALVTSVVLYLGAILSSNRMEVRQ